MLMLTRRMGESIHIGEDVTVVVSAIAGGQVRIGIAAPREIRVDRSEIRAARRLALSARRQCRVCHCSQEQACPGGCHWVDLDLCSACVDRDPRSQE